MPINPEVVRPLLEVSDEELKNLIYSTYRYDSKLGKGIADAVRYEKATGDFIGKNFSASNNKISISTAGEGFMILFPDFKKAWEEYTVTFKKKDITFSLFLNRLAQYLVELIKFNKFNNTSDFFHLIEIFLIDGEIQLQNLIATALLEDIQNYMGNQDINPDLLIQYLKPESLKWWNEINRFWHELEIFYNDTSMADSLK